MASTPYKGFGLAPMGTSKFGFGSPALANPLTGKVFKKSDGSLGDVRFIDPATRDYAFDTETGRLKGMDAVQQMVYLALVTVKESSAVTELGQNFSSIKVITSNIESVIQNEVRLALRDLIAKRLIILNQVTVQVDEHKVARIYVQWTDNTKNNLNTTII